MEEIFEYEGKRYRAVPDDSVDCAECAFVDGGCPDEPECIGAFREDGKDVVFKEVADE